MAFEKADFLANRARLKIETIQNVIIIIFLCQKIIIIWLKTIELGIILQLIILINYFNNNNFYIHFSFSIISNSKSLFFNSCSSISYSVPAISSLLQIYMLNFKIRQRCPFFVDHTTIFLFFCDLCSRCGCNLTGSSTLQFCRYSIRQWLHDTSSLLVERLESPPMIIVSC